nr:putative reverse transcriptase domain, zinc finger, CCHC-type, aspartic peptidase domain protein [Tanacetum cinerariifolium]
MPTASYRVPTSRRTSHCQRRKMPLLEEKRSHCQKDRTAINVKKKLPVKDGSYAKLKRKKDDGKKLTVNNSGVATSLPGSFSDRGCTGQKYVYLDTYHDPRDAEIECLRQWIHELETNPFDRFEEKGESSETQTTVNESEDGDDGFEFFLLAGPINNVPHPTSNPEFEGRLQPDDFLDWLQTVERIFDLRDIPDHLKGFLPVEELIREFKRMRIRCGADEDEEQVIARFLSFGHLKWDCPNKQILSFVDEPEPTYDTEEQEPTEVLYPDRGEILVSCHVLNVIPSDHGDDTTWLRKNIFRTQCTSKGKLCMVIGDGGSCENMVATTMVEKLSLPTQKHPDPYKLTWLKKGNLVKVISIDACHTLLGRPWLYDRRVKHDGFRNTYSFKKDGLIITLAPLYPRDEPQQPLTKPDFVGLTKQPTTTHVLALVMVEANPKPLECPTAVLPLLCNGIHMDNKKVEAITTCPTLTSLRDVRSFHGLVSFYRRFIKNFSTILAPITDCLKSSKFSWSTTSQAAFELLKKYVTEALVLALPDFANVFQVSVTLRVSGSVFFRKSMLAILFRNLKGERRKKVTNMKPKGQNRLQSQNAPLLVSQNGRGSGAALVRMFHVLLCHET